MHLLILLIFASDTESRDVELLRLVLFDDDRFATLTTSCEISIVVVVVIVIQRFGRETIL